MSGMQRESLYPRPPISPPPPPPPSLSKRKRNIYMRARDTQLRSDMVSCFLHADATIRVTPTTCFSETTSFRLLQCPTTMTTTYVPEKQHAQCLGASVGDHSPWRYSSKRRRLERERRVL